MSSLLLAIIFALSFGTLILYAGSFFAVSLIVVLITCTILAAKREDIKAYGQNKTVVAFTAVLTIFVVFATLSFGEAILGDATFDFLVGLTFIFLVAFIAEARLHPRIGAA
ncbi:MAG TPA: hypothetical protein VFF30_07905 [Nitrososphaerales archaeon]|nr:hypothetical protein [Nitrososphaerales archaeon]